MVSLGNQAFLPQWARGRWVFFGAGAVSPPQLSDKLGYIMLLRGVPAWVTEEGFQEAGGRMQMLDG